jgi:hypothetical protein
MDAAKKKKDQREDKAFVVVGKAPGGPRLIRSGSIQLFLIISGEGRGAAKGNLLTCDMVSTPAPFTSRDSNRGSYRAAQMMVMLVSGVGEKKEGKSEKLTTRKI